MLLLYQVLHQPIGYEYRRHQAAQLAFSLFDARLLSNEVVH